MSAPYQCPFCKIVNGQSRVIKRGKLATVFLSNPRLTIGHTLIVPNRHIEDPRDLSSAELLEIFEEIKMVETKLLASKLAEGCDIRQNFRPFLPQSNIKIDHLHFHVLPRNPQDEYHQKVLKHELEMFTTLLDKEEQEMIKLLK